MGKIRKIVSANDRARMARAAVPFLQPSIKEDPVTKEVRVEHKGQRWPRANDPIDEKMAIFALQHGTNQEARRIVGRYLRETQVVSLRVLDYITDMIDPPEDCAYPFIFQFKRHSTKTYKLDRYLEIGRQFRAIRNGDALKAAIYQMVRDFGVSERDAYRGLALIEGKMPWRPEKAPNQSPRTSGLSVGMRKKRRARNIRTRSG